MKMSTTKQHSLTLVNIQLDVKNLYLFIYLYKACPSESGTDKFMRKFI
jgi:hypothetical protein